jgi:hypothetical protein
MTWSAPRTWTTGEIVTAAMMNGVRDELLALQATSASIATAETTTSTTYVDLATVGPAITISTSTTVLVFIQATMSVNGVFNAFMGAAVSGATTLGASDTDAVNVVSSVANHTDRQGVAFRITGLTAGSNTFTAKYRVSGGTGSFANRHMVLIAA